jgi:hypothetical protein
MAKDIRSVPINLIRKSDGKSARQLAAEIAQSGYLPDDPFLPEEVIEGAIAMMDRAAALSNKRKRFPSRRPYAYRKAVIDEVARIASSRFKKPITARLVTTCWQEYTAHARRDFNA